MIDWLNSNTGIVVTIFGGVITAGLGVFGLIITRRGRSFDEALAAKDATIELIRAQNVALSRDIASHEAHSRAEDEKNKLKDEIVDVLHKRISELETRQFFESSESGDIVLRGKSFKIISKDGEVLFEVRSAEKT